MQTKQEHINYAKEILKKKDYEYHIKSCQRDWDMKPNLGFQANLNIKLVLSKKWEWIVKMYS